MNCPYCGKPMEEGVLNSRSPIHWSEETTGFSIPTHKRDVPLGPLMGLLRPRAHLCRTCGKVVINCK